MQRVSGGRAREPGGVGTGVVVGAAEVHGTGGRARHTRSEDDAGRAHCRRGAAEAEQASAVEPARFRREPGSDSVAQLGVLLLEGFHPLCEELDLVREIGHAPVRGCR